jgi:hypothetical protein
MNKNKKEKICLKKLPKEEKVANKNKKVHKLKKTIKITQKKEKILIKLICKKNKDNINNLNKKINIKKIKRFYNQK